MIKRLIPILSILLIFPACAVSNSLAQGDQPRTSDVQSAAPAVETGCSESPDEGFATSADPLQTAANGCPSTFCTASQKRQCSLTCHGKGIGLVCDDSTCTSQCICGSVPPGGAPSDLSPSTKVDPLQAAANSCPSSFCTASQKRQCSLTCHGKGIGLVCDYSSCTSECICGSVPPG